jgi:hypothetical protein
MSEQSKETLEHFVESNKEDVLYKTFIIWAKNSENRWDIKGFTPLEDQQSRVKSQEDQKEIPLADFFEK